MARIVYFKTGVVAPDGYEEMGSTELCNDCDREAEYFDKELGFCEEHYAEHLKRKAEDAMEERAEYQEGTPEETEERELHRAEIAELDRYEEDGLLD